MKYYQIGQSVIELLVALGIFVIVVSSLVFLILDSYVAGRLGAEITRADFLAEEGMEAVRSIRDNNWSALTPGDHSLAISGNNWVFQGTEEDVSDQLREGIRKVIIEDVGPDRKKITSQVTWQFTKVRPQQIKLITYLTNWQKVASVFTQNDWRWYENIDDLTLTTALAAENEEISNVSSNQILRLRMNLLVEGLNLPSFTQAFKLQHASATGACSSLLEWIDLGNIGSLEIWRGYDNPTSSDGTVLPSLLLASSTVAESYEEANDSINNPQTIPIKGQGEWDWVIQNNDAPESSAYCFRMVKSDGLPLDIYNPDSYPKLTTAAAPGAYCTGTSFPCDQFPDQTVCQSQEGCSWLDPFCGGTCTSCRGLSQTQCNQQDGCTWFWFFCRGNCTSCGTYTDQPSCQGQLGCSWNPGECSGTPFSCGSYGTRAGCEAQQGCQWIVP